MIRRGASLARALWLVVIPLVVIGVAAAAGRTMFVSDLVTRAEPARQHIFRSLGIDDPFVLDRPAETRRFDSRYGNHPLPGLLHVIPGALFLILAQLQFSSRIRRRYIRFHRWSGRLLLGLAIVTVASAFYFGWLMPYGGSSEAIAITLFGALFLFSLGRAFLAIRRGDIARHREWMIRAFAIAIGISTVRVFGTLFDVALTPAGWTAQAVFLFAVWAGWLTTSAAAEVWIRRTRPRASALAVPAATT